MGGSSNASGPDFAHEGFAASELAENVPVVGQVEGEGVVLVRCDGEVHATGASCTHYGGPLGEGIVSVTKEGVTIRCPWHHARFDLRTGEAVDPPALGAIPCYRVEQRGDRLFVIGKKEQGRGPGGNPVRSAKAAPKSVVIVGGGPAGAVAAEALRREGYEGPITIVSADADDPVDRPNLSKDYLAGNAPEEWIPLRGADFFTEHRIERRHARVIAIDASARTLTLATGDLLAWDALVLATGAEPNRLNIPGADLSHVHVVRSFADTRRLIAAAAGAKRAVVLGASFIGLEVAASLRARGLDVHVVGREKVPLEHVLGAQLGAVVRAVHEAKGEVFHLGHVPTKIDEKGVTLDNGTVLDADLVVMGVGVRPNVALAEAAGIAVDRGIVVDGRFRTNVAGVYAIGDVARVNGVRIEHWVVAEQHALSLAKVIVGRGEDFARVPFFWSAHHDLVINYVGHAEKWDRADVSGDPAARDCAVAYRHEGRTLAVATIGRDRESLLAEVALEKADESALRVLVPGA